MEKDNSKSAVAWLIMLVVVLVVGLTISIAALVEANGKMEKYEAIFDVACGYGTSKTKCEQGLDMLKNMDTKDIKKWAR